MIYSNDTPVGIDAAIDIMQNKLNQLSYTDINMNDSLFFDKIFPLTYKNPENRPIWRSNKRNDNIGVFPDDNHKNVSWFYLEGSANQIAHNTEQAKVNLVIWFRTSDIDTKANDMAKTIADFVRYKFFRKTNGSYQNPEYFYNKEDVFSEYSLDNDILKSYAPFSAFRIRFDLTYKIQCKPEYTQQFNACGD